MDTEEQKKKNREYMKIWRKKDPERLELLNGRANAYYHENKKRINELRKMRYQKNKDKISAKLKEDRANNPEKYSVRAKKYRDKRNANKEKYKAHLEYLKEYRQKNRAIRNKKEQERKTKDPAYKLACNVRSKLLKIINRKQKSTAEIIGCNWKQLKQHLESQFKPGMTWENHGQFGWHVDHVTQLCTAKNDPDRLIELCHYTNLQPLWWRENLNKRFY